MQQQSKVTPPQLHWDLVYCLRLGRKAVKRKETLFDLHNHMTIPLRGL